MRASDPPPRPGGHRRSDDRRAGTGLAIRGCRTGWRTRGATTGARRYEPCSRLYQQDAWQLVVSGLAGGKGVPDSMAGHPTLFVTLTAPSFGPVHTRATDDAGRALPCRAPRDEAGDPCEHGQPTTCAKRHAEDDPEPGRPLRMDCWLSAVDVQSMIDLYQAGTTAKELTEKFDIS
ncbi:MAG: replication initiator [Egibacteraceae bacterium]